MKPLTSVLYISYPMLPVSDASCGGAEQMLWVLEREMAARGVRTAVAACGGSAVSGELISTGRAPTQKDQFEARAEEHCGKILAICRERRFSLIHDKSGFFWRYANEVDVPVLATLHLPRSFYRSELFQSVAPNVYFNCVSNAQAKEFAELPGMLGVVPNGIALNRFRFESRKKDYVLWLGRICPEKAPHLAMDAAKRARIRLVMAGQVYPFLWHQLYFDQEIRPRLERDRDSVTWIERPSFEEKVGLLGGAKALLLPTLAPETSSLVSMEAMASGTPVIAFPNGALTDIVRPGVSGIFVKTVEEMSAAIAYVGKLRPRDARMQAEHEFSASAMADGYQRLYSAVLSETEQDIPQAA